MAGSTLGLSYISADDAAVSLLTPWNRDIEDIWRDHFDYFYREYDEFIFPMTIHPDVSGRPHVVLMHER